MKIKNFGKTFVVVVLATTLFLPYAALANVEKLATQTGNHTGEMRNFEYWIEYLDSQGITTANATGIYFKPFNWFWSYMPTLLPVEYYGDYPLYFVGNTLRFKVHIKNVSKRTFKNLKVITAQELLNVEGGWGIPFPSPYTQNWLLSEFGPGEEVILEGSMLIPNLQTSGIDQTHLQILHWDNDDDTSGNSGRIIVDDPQAGLWCPLVGS